MTSLTSADQSSSAASLTCSAHRLTNSRLCATLARCWSLSSSKFGISVRHLQFLDVRFERIGIKLFPKDRITVVSDDDTGPIARVTTLLFERDVNIEDLDQAVRDGLGEAVSDD